MPSHTVRSADLGQSTSLHTHCETHTLSNSSLLTGLCVEYRYVLIRHSQRLPKPQGSTGGGRKEDKKGKEKKEETN